MKQSPPYFKRTITINSTHTGTNDQWVGQGGGDATPE